jgi:hypothetical protein
MIDKEVVDRLKALYSEWAELSDSKKELTESMNALVETAAEAAEVKKVSIRNAWRTLLKKGKKSEDDLDEVINIITAMEER